MSISNKGKSPFYPGQPVPVELFVGRGDLIERVMARGVRQVAAGKPISIFVQGEYGIGKSSIAGYLMALASHAESLHPIYAPLGGAETLEDVGAAVLESTIQSGALNSKSGEKIREWLAKYIGEQSLFGVRLRVDAIKKDAPDIAKGMLPFLGEVYARLKEGGTKGIFLVLDEINGITAYPKFAHLIKGIIDKNALSNSPTPLLLMLCGVEERRREMIRHHPPIDRVFDVINVEGMKQPDMETFFEQAFQSVQIKVEPDALRILTRYSAGFPKIMHVCGDAAYWQDNDGIITDEDALQAVLTAADEIGRKYVDQQVYRALRCHDYHRILGKIGESGLDMNFNKQTIEKGLTEAEKKKFNNFLQRMKKLNVLRSGDVRGEYVFNVRMVRLYIFLASLRKEDKQIAD